MKRICFAVVTLLLCQSALFSQDLFRVEKGQFVEQVYGGSLLEEGKDIIDYNSDHLMTGWIENQYEEETTSIDAAFWYISNVGEEILHTSYGSIEYAEIGEALATNNDLIYLALRKTLITKMDENVSIGDSLIVIAIDIDGVIQWQYRKGVTEAGIAPKDIIIDSDGNLAVLANNITGSGIQGTMVIKLDQSGSLLQQSNSYYGNTEEGVTSFELIEYPDEHYYTICNDIGGLYPISVLFEMYSPTNIIDFPYTTQRDRYLFGFTLKNTDSIYAAGFSVYEGDTDAFIVEIDSAFSINKTKRHGTSGLEMLKDIGQTSEGFIAGGLANNRGEGGVDCYLFQIDQNLNSVTVEETFGSKYDETFHHMRVKMGDPKAYFAGQTLEFGQEFGNAYVGGSLSFPQGPVGSNCFFERIAYFQKPIIFGSDDEVSGTNSLIQNPTAFFAVADKYNIDHIILYDIDKLFRFYDLYGQQPIGDPATTSQSAYLDAMYYILNLINTAKKDNKGISFGMAVGAWSEYIDRSTLVNDAIATSNLINATNPGKISFYVLENEFWNFIESGEELESQSESDFRTSNRVNTLLGGDIAPGPIVQAINAVGGLGPEKAEALAAYYYYQLKEREDFVKDLFISRHTNANINAVADYIGSIQADFSSAGYWSGNEVYFSSYDVTQSSGNPTTTSKIGQENGIIQYLIDGFSNVTIGGNQVSLPGVDGILFPYYINPSTHVVDYSFSDRVRNSTYTYEAFGSYSSVNDIPYIPLFSAEEVNVCTGEHNNTYSFMGPWLGGVNNPKSAEDQWVDQNIAAYKGSGATNNSFCPNCFSNTEIVGMGWFTMDCLDANQNKSGATPYTNFGQSSCNGTGTYNDLNEVKEKAYAIYPNPTSGLVKVEALLEKGVIGSLQVLNINGQLMSTSIQGKRSATVDFSNLPAGVYLLQIVNEESGQVATYKVIKQ